MRLSIWRQFSSNHSASFIIVGTFKSHEDAQQAADAVRTILRRIASYWHTISPEEGKVMWDRINHGEITPVEQDLSRELGMEWSKDIRRDGKPHGIDWIPSNPDEAFTAVKVLDHYVFVENIRQTEVGAEPFASVLRRLGATVVGNYETTQNTDIVGQGLLRVRVTCRVPDVETLQRLLSDITIGVWLGRRPGLGWPLERKLTWEEYVAGQYPSEADMAIGSELYIYSAKVEVQGLDISYSALTFWEPQQIREKLLSYLKSNGCRNCTTEFIQE